MNVLPDLCSSTFFFVGCMPFASFLRNAGTAWLGPIATSPLPKLLVCNFNGLPHQFFCITLQVSSRLLGNQI